MSPAFFLGGGAPVSDWRDLSIRDVEGLLEEWRQQAQQDERDAPQGSKLKGAADERYRQYSSYLLSLRRLTLFLTESAPKGAPSRFHVEPCPWCGRRVSLTEEAVWTCPADVRRDAPGWLPPPQDDIRELRRQRSVPTSCGRAYGLKCYADVPAHEECHRRG